MNDPLYDVVEHPAVRCGQIWVLEKDGKVERGPASVRRSAGGYLLSDGPVDSLARWRCVGVHTFNGPVFFGEYRRGALWRVEGLNKDFKIVVSTQDGQRFAYLDFEVAACPLVPTATAVHPAWKRLAPTPKPEAIVEDFHFAKVEPWPGVQPDAATSMLSETKSEYIRATLCGEPFDTTWREGALRAIGPMERLSDELDSRVHEASGAQARLGTDPYVATRFSEGVSEADLHRLPAKARAPYLPQRRSRFDALASERSLASLAARAQPTDASDEARRAARQRVFGVNPSFRAHFRELLPTRVMGFTGETRSERCGVAGPEGKELLLHVRMPILWTNPFKLGGVTVTGRIFRIALDEYQDLSVLGLDVDPSADVRRLVAELEASPSRLWDYFRDAPSGMRGLGGPIFFTGEDVRRAAYVGDFRGTCTVEMPEEETRS